MTCDRCKRSYPTTHKLLFVDGEYCATCRWLLTDKHDKKSAKEKEIKAAVHLLRDEGYTVKKKSKPPKGINIVMTRQPTPAERKEAINKMFENMKYKD